jgi:hypothetical protein
MPTQSKRKPTEKDLLTKLADAGEEALNRIVELPGGHRMVEAVNLLRERLDDLQSRLRSLDPLERRVTELERRLATMEGKRKPAPARRKPKPAPPTKTTP